MFLYAQVYFLLRAGHYADAVDCLSSKANTLRTSDSALPAALKAWVENNQHLPEQHRIELRKTWDLDIRNKENVDQFRVALYKIIGRIDMAKKGVKVATSTEDWVWVNLMLTREGLEDSPVDRYTLKDFATVVAGLPRERYDQKGQKPLVWVNLLLQAGEFEEVSHIGTVGAAFSSGYQLTLGRGVFVRQGAVPNGRDASGGRAAVLWLAAIGRSQRYDS